MTDFGSQNFNLTYLSCVDIKNEAEGLIEPSGLALSHKKKSLWTVSDDTRKIFKLGLDGNIKRQKSFDIPENGLEGIALSPTGEFLVTVKEDNNEIIEIRVDSREVVYRQRLAGLACYETVAQYFLDTGVNKGLEGVTWNCKTGALFVIKEGNPGLLIEISSNLRTIQSHQLLNEKNGFIDTEVAPDEMDFSDICYDRSRDKFWIISDKASRLFLYDWQHNKVTGSAKLSYGKDGEYREVEKAEGITINSDANRLYVVSDKEARLYVFDIRE